MTGCRVRREPHEQGDVLLMVPKQAMALTNQELPAGTAALDLSGRAGAEAKAAGDRFVRFEPL